MKYIIGMDAGGTKTDSVLVSRDMKIIYSLKSTGFNLSSDDMDKALKVIEGVLLKLTSLFKKEDIGGLSIAAAGAGRIKEQFQQFLSSKLNGKYNFEKIKVMTDADAALEGAFAGKPGFILISGTGSIMFGKDDSGSSFRAGGYGKALGDPGSGYSIGRKAFLYLSEVIDGIKEGGFLSERLSLQYNITSSDELIKLTTAPGFNFAEAVLYVLEAAEEKDEHALSVLKNESDSLCSLIKGIQKQTGRNELQVALYGSLITTDNIFARLVKAKIKSQFKDISIKEGQYSPAVGAALALLKEMDFEK